MLFSINFSTQAAVLFHQGRLRADSFKCPDWPDMIAEARQYLPAAVHFNLNAGKGKLITKDLALIEALADQTDTPYINLHLEAKTTDFPGVPIDTASSHHKQMVQKQMVEEVSLAVRRFGSQRVIVENVPYRRSAQTLRPCVEPEIISRIISETGCGLLLDLPHARISAQNLGVDEREYLESLPVFALKELHFTGVQNLDGWLQDHLPAQKEDWEVLDWVLDHIRKGEWPKPWMIAFEYGGIGGKFSWRTSASVIEKQGSRIFDLVNRI